MGRRLSSTETGGHRQAVAQPRLLQWGRRLSSTETVRPAGVEQRLGLDASMGPPTLVDGDQRELHGGIHEPRAAGASMGPPTLVDGDNDDGSIRRELRPLASMG